MLDAFKHDDVDLTFLLGFKYVDFSKDSAEAMLNLRWGVLGESPWSH